MVVRFDVLLTHYGGIPHMSSIRQCTNTVIMVEPVSFRHNADTAKDNSFQGVLQDKSAKEIMLKAAKNSEV